jgi:hypothetical protein
VLRRRLFAMAMLASAVLLCCAPGVACGLRVGAHVAFYGSSGDPDVFVWETRFRLEDYQAGSLDTEQTLLPHARLAEPGTRAIVLACVAHYVHPRYRTFLDDAVYVKLLGGQYRNQTGWVMASDLRVMRGR